MYVRCNQGLSRMKKIQKNALLSDINPDYTIRINSNNIND
jgi:hypothetical protein